MEEDESSSDTDIEPKESSHTRSQPKTSSSNVYNYDQLLDVKPRHLPMISHTGEFPDIKNIQSTPGISWPSGSWQDGTRKSAFQPYRMEMVEIEKYTKRLPVGFSPQPTTLLTNLQRGNTQTLTPVLDKEEMTVHERAGQGEISKDDVDNECDVDVLDENNLTPLMWACSYGQLPTVQLLLGEGAQIEKVGNEGETSLHLAAAGGHHDVVRLLISKGADVNKTDEMGNTALMYAAFGNHPHCVNELLSQGADMTITNENGDTAYAIVISKGSHLALAVIENHLLTLLT